MNVIYLQNNAGEPDHSYEEIRNATIDLLAGREVGAAEMYHFDGLADCVARLLLKRDARPEPRRGPVLSDQDELFFQEVFWDLFRQGAITLGLNRSNRAFPHYRVSSFGQQVIDDPNVYYFHDVSTYTKVIREQVPDIDDVTLMYLEEAMQAFMAGCLLSSAVMLGVATEHTFLLLLETVKQNTAYEKTFEKMFKERQLLHMVNKFKQALDGKRGDLPSDTLEDLDTNFVSVLALIRSFRNESGHPSGKRILREQQYINLHVFIPYCKKMHQLIEHFKQ